MTLWNPGSLTLHSLKSLYFFITSQKWRDHNHKIDQTIPRPCYPTAVKYKKETSSMPSKHLFFRKSVPYNWFQWPLDGPDLHSPEARSHPNILFTLPSIYTQVGWVAHPLLPSHGWPSSSAHTCILCMFYGCLALYNTRNSYYHRQPYRRLISSYFRWYALKYRGTLHCVYRRIQIL
jgi:hypothetical protein